MNALPGAFGALALDVALGFIPVPANWKAGMLGWVTKAIGAVGIGMAWNMFGSASTAAKMTEGALTVMIHGALRDVVATNLPAVPLGMYQEMSGLGYYGAGFNPSYHVSDQSALNAGGALSEYLPDISASEADMVATDEDYM
jgi:hypothetical protein